MSEDTIKSGLETEKLRKEIADLTTRTRWTGLTVLIALGTALVQLVIGLETNFVAVKTSARADDNAASIAELNNATEAQLKARELRAHERDITRDAIEKLSIAVAKYDEGLAPLRALTVLEDPTKQTSHERFNLARATQIFEDSYNGLAEELFKQTPKISGELFTDVTKILNYGRILAETARDSGSASSTHFASMNDPSKVKRMRELVNQFWDHAHQELGLGTDTAIKQKVFGVFQWKISEFDPTLFPDSGKRSIIQPLGYKEQPNQVNANFEVSTEFAEGAQGLKLSIRPQPARSATGQGKEHVKR